MCGAMGVEGGDAVNHRSCSTSLGAAMRELEWLDRDAAPAISGTCIFGDCGIHSHPSTATFATEAACR